MSRHNDHEPENEIETFSQELAEAVESLREEAVNEAAGRQGMMGPKKSAGNLDGSPLFGSSQLKLF